jgi:hypothetical protein
LRRKEEPSSSSSQEPPKPGFYSEPLPNEDPPSQYAEPQEPPKSATYLGGALNPQTETLTKPRTEALNNTSNTEPNNNDFFRLKCVIALAAAMTIASAALIIVCILFCPPALVVASIGMGLSGALLLDKTYEYRDAMKSMKNQSAESTQNQVNLSADADKGSGPNQDAEEDPRPTVGFKT